MENLFSSLLIYEIVLLFLGVFLFLILSIGLMYYIFKDGPIKKLLMFFMIPIVMIGYPSITEITISKDKFTLSKLQDELAKNPNNKEIKEEVEKYTEKLENRASTPTDLLQISKSNYLLGNQDKAVYFADKVLEKDRNNETAIVLKDLAINADDIRRKTPIIMPGDVINNKLEMNNNINRAKDEEAAREEEERIRREREEASGVNNVNINPDLKIRDDFKVIDPDAISTREAAAIKEEQELKQSDAAKTVQPSLLERRRLKSDTTKNTTLKRIR